MNLLVSLAIMMLDTALRLLIHQMLQKLLPQKVMLMPLKEKLQLVVIMLLLTKSRIKIKLIIKIQKVKKHGIIKTFGSLMIKVKLFGQLNLLLMN
jgi:hypothetical protein